MVAIHETMTSKDVCILLAERNHQEMGPNWTLVERLSDLHLGKDHQLIHVVGTFVCCYCCCFGLGTLKCNIGGTYNLS